MSHFIKTRGARTHNLRNIDVDIPRDKLVVITGVSGSGKSSLAFDTLLAEGQRQYVQSLSAYSRQFVDQMPRPEVDRIEGLSPTIAIDQRPGAPNPRSTVGTITEIYDYLRVLMARCGDVTCPSCGTPVEQQTPAQIEAAIRGLPENTRLMLLAPIVRGRRGAHHEAFEAIRKAGFVRARVDGTVHALEDAPPLAPQQRHDIEAVVDRIVIREGVDARLSESVRTAVRHGEGLVVLLHQSPTDKPSADWEERVFNTRYACPQCQTGIGEIEPRTFSFNSPYGACPACGGLGIAAGSPPAGVAKGGPPPATAACPECRGTRLRPEAQAVKLGGLAIHEIAAQSSAAAIDFFRRLQFEADRLPVAKPLLCQIDRRLEFLLRVGVDYLTLDRSADTLSGGERQRVRLATGIGSGLVGILYLLDEPSIGLHPRDNQRLIGALRDLQQQGNSVVVVEHDEALIRAADYVIEIGPGAGPAGGRVVALGTPQEIAGNQASITGAYLSGRRTIETRQPARIAGSDLRPGANAAKHAPRPAVQLSGVTANNLRSLDVSVPLHAFVCVTGVSGSGKSTLVLDVLAPAIADSIGSSSRDDLRRETGVATDPPSPLDLGRLSFASPSDAVDRLVVVDTNPIGRNPRSSAATYTGIWNEIRRVFAKTKQSRLRGYGAARFSFNAKGGRCEECRGAGVKRLSMSLLPQAEATCPVCRGLRFNRATLSVRYRDRSIADVLAMSVDEAADFFANHDAIHRVLATLADVGLGYLAIGQPATTLSGGEAQRIKLAAELARPAAGHTLYILDEPTSGLSTDDIGRLLGVLHRLVDQGHSMLVIEHNLEVIRTADWVIDLGPEGGAGGGRVVVAGAPEDVAACAASHTGRFLRTLLSHGVTHNVGGAEAKQIGKAE